MAARPCGGGTNRHPLMACASQRRSIPKSRVGHYNQGRRHRSLGPGVPDPPRRPTGAQTPQSRDDFGEAFIAIARSVLGGFASCVFVGAGCRLIRFLRGQPSALSIGSASMDELPFRRSPARMSACPGRVLAKTPERDPDGSRTAIRDPMRKLTLDCCRLAPRAWQLPQQRPDQSAAPARRRAYRARVRVIPGGICSVRARSGTCSSRGRASAPPMSSQPIERN